MEPKEQIRRTRLDSLWDECIMANEWYFDNGTWKQFWREITLNTHKYPNNRTLVEIITKTIKNEA